MKLKLVTIALTIVSHPLVLVHSQTPIGRYHEKDWKERVKRFNMRRHLTQPTTRDLKEGIEHSRRLAQNYNKLGLEDPIGVTLKHRQLYAGDIQYTSFDEDTPLPSKQPRFKLDPVYDNETETWSTSPDLPFNDGPGVNPGCPKLTRDFWLEDGDAEVMFDIVACPVADVAHWLSDPWDCIVGSGGISSIVDFFAEDYAALITDAMVDLAIPLAAEVLYNLSGLGWIEKVFNEVCKNFGVLDTIIGLFDSISGFADDVIDGVGDIVNDLIDRKLEAGEQLAICTEDHYETCNDPGVDGIDCNFCLSHEGMTCDGCRTCWRPLHVVVPDMKGLCMNTEQLRNLMSREVINQNTMRGLYNGMIGNYIADIAGHDAVIEALHQALGTSGSGETGGEKSIESLISNLQDDISRTRTEIFEDILDLDDDIEAAKTEITNKIDNQCSDASSGTGRRLSEVSNIKNKKDRTNEAINDSFGSEKMKETLRHTKKKSFSEEPVDEALKTKRGKDRTDEGIDDTFGSETMKEALRHATRKTFPEGDAEAKPNTKSEKATADETINDIFGSEKIKEALRYATQNGVPEEQAETIFKEFLKNGSDKTDKIEEDMKKTFRTMLRDDPKLLHAMDNIMDGVAEEKAADFAKDLTGHVLKQSVNPKTGKFDPDRIHKINKQFQKIRNKKIYMKKTTNRKLMQQNERKLNDDFIYIPDFERCFDGPEAVNRRHRMLFTSEFPSASPSSQPTTLGPTPTPSPTEATCENDMGDLEYACTCVVDEIATFIKSLIEKVLREIIDGLLAARDAYKDIATGAFPSGINIEPFRMLLGFVQMLDPISISGNAMSDVRGLIVEIFQTIVSYFLFGCSKTVDPACPGTLPSLQNKVLTLTEDRNGDIYQCTGCDSEFEGELVWYNAAYEVVYPVLDLIGDSIVEFINIPVNIIKLLILAVHYQFDHMNNVCSWIDSYVAAAKGGATFENTRLILHEIACRPPADGLMKRGYGCDGIDNNCDDLKKIDECDEDIIYPEINFIKVNENCSPDHFIFKTEQAAFDCVMTYLLAEDDCHEVNITSRTVGSNAGFSLCGTEIGVYIDVTTDVCDQYVTDQFDLVWDASLTSTSCSFSQGLNTAPIIETRMANHICGGKIFSTIEAAEECVRKNSRATDAAGGCRTVQLDVESTPTRNCGHEIIVKAEICDKLQSTSDPITVIVDDDAPLLLCNFTSTSIEAPHGGGSYQDPGLFYSVLDACGGAVSVTIEAFSNEKDISAGNNMATRYISTDGRIGFYFMASICDNQQQQQPKANKIDCITDPEKENNRFYMVQITATDNAGHTNTAKCYVDVEGTKNQPITTTPGNSTQRFSLGKYDQGYHHNHNVFMQR